MTYQTLFSLLHHPLRFDLLLLLDRREYCICELEKILGAKQYEISRQMKTLKEANVVEIRKEHKYHYYSLALDQPVLLKLLEHVKQYKDERVKELDVLIAEYAKNPIVCER